MKKLLLMKTVLLLFALVVGSTSVWADDTDVINNSATSSNLGSTGTSTWATNFSITGTSGAVYYIHSMGTKNTSNALQWNSNGFLYATKSGGKLKSITVIGTSGKSLSIYAATSAYSAAPTGTALTTMSLTGSAVTYNFDENSAYGFIAIKGKDSSTSITSISIVYENGPSISANDVNIASDATSGEKERGTLETILTFPVRSSELVIGKYLASSILGFVVGLISYLLSIPTFSIGKALFKSYEDIVFTTNIGSMFLAIFLLFLAALLSSGVCMVLAGNAKTYKEAQSSLQFISVLPMIPYFLGVMEIDNSILNLIPIANCGSALNDVIMNKA